jgi:hypothetical protein
MNSSPTSTSSSNLPAVIEASPARVAAQDKDGWLALFSPDAKIEDPVGTTPCFRGRGQKNGNDQLGRFFDTFIEGNDVRFEVRGDFVADKEAMRDVLIHTQLANGFQIIAPAHIYYRVTAEDGAQICHLAATWELRGLVGKALRQFPKGLLTLCSLGWRMLRLQGVGGWLSYLKGLTRGIFGRGRQTATALAKALNERDAQAMAALFASQKDAIEYPIGRHLTVADFFAELPSGSRMVPSDIRSAGFTTSFRFVLEGAEKREGIALLHFDPKTKAVRKWRLFG